MILIHTPLAPYLIRQETPKELRGTLLHLKAQTGEGTTHVVGVYSPPGQKEEATAIHQYTSRLMESPNTRVLTGGDWNAAWYPADRTTRQLTEADQKHSQTWEEKGFRPTRQDGRTHTFHMRHEGKLIHGSRIDDIMCNPPQVALEERVIQMGSTLDHQLLLQTLPGEALPLPLCTPAPPRTQTTGRELILPVKKQDITKTKQAIETHLSQRLYECTTDINMAYHTLIT